MEVSCMPEELLEHILSYLSVVRELQTAAQVCQLWRKICVSIFRHKHNSFLEQALKGNFVWRQCGRTGPARSNHFVAKHMKPRISAQRLSIPAPRSFHHAAFHGQSIYVYGGENNETTGSSYFNDMFKFDVLSQMWEKVSTSGTPPTPRSKVSVTRLRDTLIVSGGCVSARMRSSIRPAEIVHQDVHFYNIEKRLWYKGGTLLTSRFYHESICLENSGRITLVLTGGLTSTVEMSDSVEVCDLKMDCDGFFSISECRKIPFPRQRMFHSQAKINERTLLVYGGMNQDPENLSDHLIRTDACLIKFDESLSNCELVDIAVHGSDAYNGLYPAFVSDFARVKDSLIFFQRSGYIKQKLSSDGRPYPNFYQADTERKPTGDEIYRQDYYHTFILNFEGVLENTSVSWLPVTKNPPLLAPRYSVFHRTVLVGDCIYVFGGTVLDQRTKVPKSSNNLYKINVRRGNLR
ncbi:hypothetical protein ACHWQZ_G014622 [Mnemiopsis leidyi]